MSTARTIAKAAGFLIAANLISRILGFLRDAIIAGLFGQGSVTDAYNVAFVLPDLLYWLLVGGVLSSAFIPVLSEYIARNNEEEGWQVVSSVINITLLILSIFIIIALVFAEQFIHLLAPGLNENLNLAVQLMRIILFQPLILAMSGLSMGILNSYKIFWPSALGSVLYNVCVIVCGPLLADRLGIAGFAVGVVVGAAANFLVQIPALQKVGFRYQLSINWRHPSVQRIASLALPIILCFALNQVQVMVNANLGSSLSEGSITALYYANRLSQLPVGIFAVAIAMAVFPTITEQAALQQWDNFRIMSSRAIRMVMFITIPISIGMVVLRYPLIRVLFQHGKFTAEDTLMTAIPLVFFALGIVAQAIIQVLPRMFYALQDTWTPALVGILAMLVNLTGALILIRPMAHGGLALANMIASFVNMLLLIIILHRRLGKIDGRNLLMTFFKTALISVLFGAVVWLWSVWLTTMLGTGIISALLILVTGSLLGLLLFTLTAGLLRMEEFTQTVGLLRYRLKFKAGAKKQS
ncbi:MAG: murein biosynthesis integral membrane protein MurJ [Desulfitobacteriaceae bacterium]|nr:murein biosynthesis integral membrane protein MurJ [Desulfitobacteriaceae bacterium]MDD4345994.1 murein biosynthesis integral membrane protein MurJ [Desulfitobacteriaceae bacterium]MDD4400377.1 murein biosynthesis integral membrane protein MurJ [Desulfitobacteriaceae bacterium]